MEWQRHVRIMEWSVPWVLQMEGGCYCTARRVTHAVVILIKE